MGRGLDQTQHIDTGFLPHPSGMRFFSFFNMNTDIKARHNTLTLLFFYVENPSLKSIEYYGRCPRFFLWSADCKREDFIFQEKVRRSLLTCSAKIPEA